MIGIKKRGIFGSPVICCGEKINCRSIRIEKYILMMTIVGSPVICCGEQFMMENNFRQCCLNNFRGKAGDL